MHLLTQNQAKELDQLSSSDYNISTDSLMNRAGEETAKFIISKYINMEAQKLQLYAAKAIMVEMDSQQLCI